MATHDENENLTSADRKMLIETMHRLDKEIRNGKEKKSFTYPKFFKNNILELESKLQELELKADELENQHPVETLHSLYEKKMLAKEIKDLKKELAIKSDPELLLERNIQVYKDLLQDTQNYGRHLDRYAVSIEEKTGKHMARESIPVLEDIIDKLEGELRDMRANKAPKEESDTFSNDDDRKQTPNI